MTGTVVAPRDGNGLRILAAQIERPLAKNAEFWAMRRGRGHADRVAIGSKKRPHMPLPA
jgi:hypothetical protein